MKSAEISARSIDEAIEEGLAQLGLSLDEADIEILDEGTKGLFGLGAKRARVLIKGKDTPAVRAERFLTQLTSLMGADVAMDIDDSAEDSVTISITGDTHGMLIGHRGETLDAVQYLTSLAVNKQKQGFTRVTLDCEHYRAKREETLVALAARLADKCKKTGRRVTLEPMNPYERRVLHSALQDDPDVTTHSEGEEPNRRVVIVPN